jgi:hypothetical protein
MFAGYHRNLRKTQRRDIKYATLLHEPRRRKHCHCQSWRYRNCFFVIVVVVSGGVEYTQSYTIVSPMLP